VSVRARKRTDTRGSWIDPPQLEISRPSAPRQLQRILHGRSVDCQRRNGNRSQWDCFGIEAKLLEMFPLYPPGKSRLLFSEWRREVVCGDMRRTNSKIVRTFPAESLWRGFNTTKAQLPKLGL